jgi:hypothetical protein
VNATDTRSSLHGAGWEMRVDAPPVLGCGHTKVQHGDLGCARVTRIEADIERVKRRAERRERWLQRLSGGAL